MGSSTEPFEVLLQAYSNDESLGTAEHRADSIDTFVQRLLGKDGVELNQRAYRISRSLDLSIPRLREQAEVLRRVAGRDAAVSLMNEAVKRSVEGASDKVGDWKSLYLAADTLQWAKDFAKKNGEPKAARKWGLLAREKWRAAFTALRVGSGWWGQHEEVAQGFAKSLMEESDEATNNSRKRDLLMQAWQVFRTFNARFAFGAKPVTQPPILLDISWSLGEIGDQPEALEVANEAVSQLRVENPSKGRLMQRALMQSYLLNCRLGHPDDALDSMQQVLRLVLTGDAAAFKERSSSLPGAYRDDFRDFRRFVNDQTQVTSNLLDLLASIPLGCSR